MPCGGFFSKKSGSSRDLEMFLTRKLPIFWIMGPSTCGKSTLSHMLALSSKYTLIKVSKLIKEEATKGRFRSKLVADALKRNRPINNEILVSILEDAMLAVQSTTTGYVIDGFPISVAQARVFEKTLGKPSMIIYVTLILDSLLSRLMSINGHINIELARQQHIEDTNACKKIFRKYESRALKVIANYPAEDTCTKLVTDLEDFWGYKFDRLFNKN